MLRILFGGFVVTVVVPAVLAVVLTLHRWSKYPEKSFYNNFLNVALTPMRWLKLGPFKQGKITLEKAMKYAMKKTKLSDFGDTTFVKNYELIADSPEMKALELTNIGYFSYRIEMNMTMVRRLKMIDYLKRNPEVLNVSVREPVFVFGMPRTGTTFLHRLLSLDPAVRAPLTWELLASVPDVDQNASKEDFAKDGKYLFIILQ